jgi:hypothetical protein
VVVEEGRKKRLAVAAAMVREDCGRRWAINRGPFALQQRYPSPSLWLCGSWVGTSPQSLSTVSVMCARCARAGGVGAYRCVVQMPMRQACVVQCK